MISCFAMRNRRSLVAAAALAAVLGMAAARAWTSDDAFITFRVVDQFLAGHGPVYNIGERVQVFTHPLWLFLLAAWRATGASLFPGAMALSVALFGVGLALLFAAFRAKPLALAIAFTVLFLCRPVVDFASGGLETPATFLLFAAAVLALRGGRERTALALLALLPLNRLDLLPWIVPFAVLVATRGTISRVAVAGAIAAPAAAWALFATIYYGSPLPNTAIAKLSGPVSGRLDAGLAYVAGSFANDPGALALLVAAPALALWQWRRNALAPRDRALVAAAACAAAIGVAYPVWTGGDFMLGRFILPALWALVVLFLAAFPEAADVARGRRAAAATLGALAAFHMVTGHSTTNLRLRLPEASLLRAVSFAGATDERRVYLPWLGAHSATRHVRGPDTSPATEGARPVVMLGEDGFATRRDQAVVDIFGLADPLLARVAALPNGRPGHGFRPLPQDFQRWRLDGFRFGDERLDALAAILRRVHRSPELWSAERFAAMARLATFGTIDSGALSVVDDGTTLAIRLVPAKLLRSGDVAFPKDGARLVWIRRYDVGRLKFGDALLRGIDRECRTVEVPAERSDTTGIEVRGAEPLVLWCAKSELGGDGLLVRVGTFMPSGRILYDEVVPVYRPVLAWTSGLPAWLVQGWTEKPKPAIVIAFVLGLAALLLWRRAARGRTTRA